MEFRVPRDSVRRSSHKQGSNNNEHLRLEARRAEVDALCRVVSGGGVGLYMYVSMWDALNRAHSLAGGKPGQIKHPLVDVTPADGAVGAVGLGIGLFDLYGWLVCFQRVLRWYGCSLPYTGTDDPTTPQSTHQGHPELPVVGLGVPQLHDPPRRLSCMGVVCGWGLWDRVELGRDAQTNL